MLLIKNKKLLYFSTSYYNIINLKYKSILPMIDLAREEKIKFKAYNSVQTTHPNNSTISFVMLLVFTGIVLLPIPSALAVSDEDDFDHDEDIGDVDRIVDT